MNNTNQYFKVDGLLTLWAQIGMVESDDTSGFTVIYDPVFLKMTISTGSEIHVIDGAYYAVRDDGVVLENVYFSEPAQSESYPGLEVKRQISESKSDDLNRLVNEKKLESVDQPSFTAPRYNSVEMHSWGSIDRFKTYAVNDESVARIVSPEFIEEFVPLWRPILCRNAVRPA